MSVIEEARKSLDVDPVRLSQIATKYELDPQEAVERIAYRRAVIDRGGRAAALMASVVLGRTFKGVSHD